MTHKERLVNLKRDLCSEIEKEFKFIGGEELEFKQPFIVRASVGNFSHYAIEDYLIRGIIDGNELLYKVNDNYGSIPVHDLEDLVDIAHVLDELQAHNIKIVSYDE